jgi:glycosyltransferase involved in cell wall biosynthesis
MKKLAVLALSQPENGGTFQYTIAMIEALRLLPQWTITIYTGINNDHYNHFGFLIRYVEATPRQWPLLTLAGWAGIKLGDPFKDEDVVIAPIYSPILLHTRKPFVYTLHDVQEFYFPGNFTFAQKVWRKQIHSMLVKRAARVICESEYVRKDIQRFFNAPAGNVIVITSPPIRQENVTRNEKRIEEVRKKYKLPSQYLFYPAQFWPHKNHSRLVDAFASIANEFPDIHLVFTGKKRDEYERVFQKVADLGLTQKVLHTGYVDQEDLPGLYQGAFALVMPSLFESVSIPVYEAFQYGVAVACSNVVALPEQVGNAGVLFDPMSEQSMIEAMRGLLKDPSSRLKLIDEGHKQISGMTHERYAQQLDELLVRYLPTR